jgi:hypothetical protein
MKLKSGFLALIVVTVLFGGILISNSMGWWVTESTKKAAVFTEGEFAGMPNPADIRGSYTFGDIEKNFGVPIEVLAQAFHVPVDDAVVFPVKELEALSGTSEVEIGTASVRLFVAFYSGLPYDLSGAEIYLTDSAVEILSTRTLSSEQMDYLNSHTISLSESVNQSAEPAPELEAQSSVDTPEGTEALIKGKTTLAEVLSWGVSQEAIEKVLGLPMPAETLTVIKDFAISNGLDFETIKENLQSLVDDMK